MIDSDEKSLKVESYQTKKVEVCKSCGVSVGATHHYWCVYYPDHLMTDSYTTDADYEAYF